MQQPHFQVFGDNRLAGFLSRENMDKSPATYARIMVLNSILLNAGEHALASSKSITKSIDSDALKITKDVLRTHGISPYLEVPKESTADINFVPRDLIVVVANTVENGRGIDVHLVHSTDGVRRSMPVMEKSKFYRQIESLADCAVLLVMDNKLSYSDRDFEVAFPGVLKRIATETENKSIEEYKDKTPIAAMAGLIGSTLLKEGSAKMDETLLVWLSERIKDGSVSGLAVIGGTTLSKHEGKWVISTEV